MKENVRMSRTAGYLEKMFRQLNKDFFASELEEPVITIQDTPKAYGHVSVEKIWKVKDSYRHELNIGAGFLYLPIEEVVATLLHEMCHLSNMMHGIQDTSRGNKYHNEKFKSKAEEVGLIVKHDAKYGYTDTSPSESLILYVAEQGWEDILINRDNTDTGHSTKSSSTRKYICPDCGISVRATKTVSIICADCLRIMVVEKRPT